MAGATGRPGMVIVGAGLAGAKAAEALRDAGFDGQITIVGQEAHRPYERPPLSKDHLHGTVIDDKLFVHSEDWYGQQDIDLRLSTPVVGLNRGTHEIVTQTGERLPYDKLLLATGSSPRRLGIPGGDLNGVHYLRTLDDNEGLKHALRPGAHAVVIGGGWIGMEVAAAARVIGADVTVLEVGDLPLAGVLGPQMAAVFADLHADNGVEVRGRAHVTGIRRGAGNSAGAVTLTDGTDLPADVVIIGIGATPNDDLARRSGLATKSGVVVDEHLTSTDPDVYAVGDVAHAFHPFYGRYLRVEHWANALNQPAAAARAMLGGPAAYDRLPYFYSDQYDLGMEYIGHLDPATNSCIVVRGDLATRQFVALWLEAGRVVAGMAVNVGDLIDPLRHLIRSRAAVDPATLADPHTPLTDLIPPEGTDDR